MGDKPCTLTRPVARPAGVVQRSEAGGRSESDRAHARGGGGGQTYCRTGSRTATSDHHGATGCGARTKPGSIPVIDEEIWIALEHHNAKRIVGLEHADQFLEFEDGVWVLEVDGRVAESDLPVSQCDFADGELG
jgi:hypothetical protein